VSATIVTSLPRDLYLQQYDDEPYDNRFVFAQQNGELYNNTSVFATLQ
jgi:hypothetical protein